MARRQRRGARTDRVPGNAKELGRAAHAAQLGYIRQTRRQDATGMRSAKALDLHWAASANKESIVVEGYEYAQQLDWRPGMGRQPLN